jgi:ribosome-binding protein aMBF1 (putative translation factor)
MKRKTREERGVYPIHLEVDESYAKRLEKLKEKLGLSRNSLTKLALSELFERYKIE